MQKRLLLIVASIATLLSIKSFAQTNTFPSSGNVGIGTTSPSQKFTVTNASGAETFHAGMAQGLGSDLASIRVLNATGNYQMVMFAGSGYQGLLSDQAMVFAPSGSESMRLHPNGNVGIGTNSPGYKLDVNGSGRFNNSVIISNSDYSINTSSAIGALQGSSCLYYAYNGGMVYGYNTDGLLFAHGTTGNNVGGFYRSALSNSTNGGNAFVIGNNYGGYSPSSGSNSYSSLLINPFINSTGGTNTIRGLYYNPVLTSMTGVTHRAIETVTGDVLLATTSGNVGIGTTSPLAPLGVQTTATGTPTVLSLTTTQTDANPGVGLAFGSGSNISGASRVIANRTGASGEMDIALQTNSTTRLFVGATTGNIGIGTSSPSQKFAVANGSGVETFHAGMAQGLGTELSSIRVLNATGNYQMIMYAGSGTQGLLSDQSMVFAPGGYESVRLLNTGNVGIGLTSPSEKLDVNGNIKSTGFILPTGAGAGKVLTSDGSGNATWQTATGGSSGWSYDGNTVGVLKKIGTTDNYALPFITNNVERMRIGTNGNIGIGTSNISDANYKLFVETGIRTRKVKVDQITWADYVFHPSYQLPSLTEVEVYIKEHQHLKDIPSAEEVKKNGLDLGDTQAALLKKIEEMTLYLIQQQKEIEALKKEINKKK